MNLPYREGDIGNMYGFQLKHAGAEYQGCDFDYTNKGFNQIDYCLNLLKKDKYSRRIIEDNIDAFAANPIHASSLFLLLLLETWTKFND